MFKHFALHKARIAIASILFLLVSQSFALLHSAEHYFHDADPLCSIFQSVEHSTPGIITPQLLNEVPLHHSFSITLLARPQVNTHHYAYHSRAPPLV